MTISNKMHPFHVMLVHFPTGLYPFYVLSDLLGVIHDDLSFANAAFYALICGYGGSIIAAIFGAIDYFNIKTEHPGWSTASRHAALNIIWIIGFTIVLKLRYHYFVNTSVTNASILFVSTFLLLGMFYSNYLGGKLIFTYGIGVKKT